MSSKNPVDQRGVLAYYCGRFAHCIQHGFGNLSLADYFNRAVYSFPHAYHHPVSNVAVTMRSQTLELLPELLELLLSGLVAVALSVAGVYLEHFAFVTVQGGETMLGLWAIVPGIACLTFAYAIATDKAVPKLAELRAGLASNR